MYLVHAHLAPPPGTGIPQGIAARVHAARKPEEGIQHVTLHSGARPHPVLGLFVSAPSLAAAEYAARAVCLRALADDEVPPGIGLARCEAPLLTPYYELLLAPPAPAPAGVDAICKGRFVQPPDC
ncbi:hypothetical protein [Streptomyces abikoensis]